MAVKSQEMWQLSESGVADQIKSDQIRS